MKLHLQDLSPRELRALAGFLPALADAREQDRADRKDSFKDVCFPKGGAPAEAVATRAAEPVDPEAQQEVLEFANAVADLDANHRNEVKRKRRTKAEMEAARASETAQAAEADPQPAVGNTGSAQPGASFPVDGATETAGEQVAPSTAPAVTAEQLRGKLQEVVAKGGDKEGLRAAGAIIGKFGYVKVKDIAEKDFAAIVAECDKALAS